MVVLVLPETYIALVGVGLILSSCQSLKVFFVSNLEKYKAIHYFPCRNIEIRKIAIILVISVKIENIVNFWKFVPTITIV